MKTMIRFLIRRNARNFSMLTFLMLFSFSGTYAQQVQTVSGKLLSDDGNQAVPFANVVMISLPDSSFQRGTIADVSGNFRIGPLPAGDYNLTISMIGFKPSTESISVKENEETDAGIIIMQDTAIALEELLFVSDRMKAKTENGKTTYFITKKMLDVSATGTGILKMIPGIQVDFMQNISLEGSRNILIFVDGKERDRNFLSQINPAQIEKVEVISSPPSNYDGNISGVINIVLKQERESGFNGQVYAEIPASGSEIFIFPSYSLNYGFKKWNLYTSYNGEMTYLDIHESTVRKVPSGPEAIEITSNQYLRQKDWSHRFHYGFDYFLSKKDQVNFYAFYNPYSRELDGTANMYVTGTNHKEWQAGKEDTDINSSASYSLYYKHIFNSKGSEFSLDVTNYNLRAENTTVYHDLSFENSTVLQSNSVMPKIDVKSIRADYTACLGNKVMLGTGVKGKFRAMQDRNSKNFKYGENVLAAYGSSLLRRQIMI